MSEETNKVNYAQLAQTLDERAKLADIDLLNDRSNACQSRTCYYLHYGLQGAAKAARVVAELENETDPLIAGLIAEIIEHLTIINDAQAPIDIARASTDALYAVTNSVELRPVKEYGERLGYLSVRLKEAVELLKKCRKDRKDHADATSPDRPKAQAIVVKQDFVLPAENGGPISLKVGEIFPVEYTHNGGFGTTCRRCNAFIPFDLAAAHCQIIDY